MRPPLKPGFLLVAKRECRWLLHDRVALILIFGVPLFAFAVLAIAFSQPVIRGLGVVVTDADRSETSRAFVESVAASPGLNVVERANDLASAARAIRSGEGKSYPPHASDLRGCSATNGFGRGLRTAHDGSQNPPSVRRAGGRGVWCDRPRGPKVPSPLPTSPRSRPDRREPQGGGGPAEGREIVPRPAPVPSPETSAPPVRPGVRSRGTTAKGSSRMGGLLSGRIDVGVGEHISYSGLEVVDVAVGGCGEKRLSREAWMAGFSGSRELLYGERVERMYG